MPQWDAYDAKEVAVQRLSDIPQRLDAATRLKNERKELTARIEKIDYLLAIFAKNPDLEKVLNLTRELL